MLTTRDFLGDDVYKAWLRDFEEMRHFRNLVSKRRPSPEEILQLKINKPWESFYRAIFKVD